MLKHVTQVSNTTNKRLGPTQHPLQNAWMFWYNKVNRSHAYEADLVKIHVAKTVEEFWAVFSVLKHPNDLSFMAEVSMFKMGIDPKWEDPVNFNGGRWVFELDAYSQDHDDLYQLLLLTIISDSLGPLNDLITGVSSSNRRRRIRISIWLQIVDERVIEIGKRLKNALGSKTEWYFETFESARSRDQTRGRGVEKKHII
ncbi:Eukaryotic translation initiation factor 4E-2 [Thelohanellus kitauei]|uniref:Eukaryotic translation initiation factor 4E-2 n=1 Tax=Thelohanellus kitauei TaxID=669202 RepID=A0A0C2N8V2_THEKT|nr:Eukaryotic translation initiation factor 4E-2 [Thelohanellus kitauei]